MVIGGHNVSSLRQGDIPAPLPACEEGIHSFGCCCLFVWVLAWELMSFRLCGYLCVFCIVASAVWIQTHLCQY